MKRFLLFSFLLAPFTATIGQELERRSFLGISMENVTADVQRIMQLPDTSGALINRVVPRSTAEAAGFKKGDVLLSINNERITSPQQAVAIVGAQKGQATFSYKLIRDKKTISGQAAFKTYPKEEYPDLDVEYTEAATKAGVQRIIIAGKKGQTKQPMVVFLGGIGCYSLDSPLDTNRSEIQLLNKLARAGYTTVRIEKPGIGDGAGKSTPCNEVGFKDEVSSYVDAVNDLKKRPQFAGLPIYIIGHSMGGVMAPLIGAETPVDGIIAYGTIGSNFMEYLLKTRRTIGEAYGWEPAAIDSFVKECCECSGYYFVDKMTPREAAAKNPHCDYYVSIFDLRSRRYNQELYDLNIPTAWKNYKGKSLLVWGESDYVAAKHDHELVVDAVNYYHKGNASFATVKGADHGMNSAASFSEATNNPGAYNPAVGELFLDWLKKQS